MHSAQSIHTRFWDTYDFNRKTHQTFSSVTALINIRPPEGWSTAVWSLYPSRSHHYHESPQSLINTEYSSSHQHFACISVCFERWWSNSFSPRRNYLVGLTYGGGGGKMTLMSAAVGPSIHHGSALAATQQRERKRPNEFYCCCVHGNALMPKTHCRLNWFSAIVEAKATETHKKAIVIPRSQPSEHHCTQLQSWKK